MLLWTHPGGLAPRDPGHTTEVMYGVSIYFSDLKLPGEIAHRFPDGRFCLSLPSATRNLKIKCI